MAIHEWIVNGSISENLLKRNGYKELVRCANCKYYNNPRKCIVAAYLKAKDIQENWMISKDFYCADGKRKGDVKDGN